MRGQVHLSFVDLRCARLPAELIELSPHEQNRAARLGSADRRRYEAAHCALRAEIRDYAGIASEPLQFARGQYGKPALTNAPDCHFSLSYSGNHAMIALASGLEIGADIECARPIDEVEELAAYYFHPRERIALLARPPGNARNVAFLRGWTRKEACIKAAGYGLSLPTESFFSGIEPCSLDTVLEPTDQDMLVSVTSACCTPPGYIAAWATVSPRG